MQVPKNHETVLEFVELGTLRDGVLVFPTLYGMDTHGNYIIWTIYVGLCDRNDELIPIQQSYIDRGDLPKDAYGVYWTEYGREGMTITTSERTPIYEGSNIGKTNYTTPFTQAVLRARTEYNKKIRKGNNTDKQALKMPGDTYKFEELFADRNRGKYPWRVFAMTLHDYKKFPDKIHFPAAIQVKLDGTLFITVHHPLLSEVLGRDMDGYSRGREAYEGYEYLYDELITVARKYPGLHFVGELWKKGYGLQDISGSSRRKTDSKLTTTRVQLNYNIFDCFYIHEPETGFMARQSLLDAVFAELTDAVHVKRIKTRVVSDAHQMKRMYQSFLKQNFEGAVIRNLQAPYEFGIDKCIRSYQTMKLKPRPDAEWPVVGFTTGKGKEDGCVIWICAESDSGVTKRLKTQHYIPLEERLTFNVTPNQPTALRKHIYARLMAEKDLFPNYICGQEAVISYSILADKTGLPQQPKMLRFKDSIVVDMLAQDADPEDKH
jgi:hypothetical protein